MLNTKLCEIYLGYSFCYYLYSVIISYYNPYVLHPLRISLRDTGVSVTINRLVRVRVR